MLSFKTPMICASIMERSTSDFLRTAEDARSADLVEIRADGIAGLSAGRLRKLIGAVKERTKKPVILTIRPRNEGGLFEGEEERANILMDCASTADIVDLELSMDRHARGRIMERAHTSIISHHDFSGTPSKQEMLNIVKREFKEGADIAKVAVRAESAGDVMKLLNATKEASTLGKVCMIAMGSEGRMSRIIAPVFGSVITYGYVNRPTAPGQASVDELNTALQILGLRE
ncbi:MAG: type I 3-dehydroquinate dehydratase [Candidatus Hydrothermarchaeaceae archaeon]